VVAIGFTGVFGGWAMRTLGDVSARSGGDGGWVNVVGCDGLPFCPNYRTPRKTDKSGLAT